MPMLLTLALAALAAPPLDAVVLIVQGSTTCAGTRVSADGDVVTAYHCVAAGGRPRVVLRDGRAATGRVVATSPADDLAVVAVPELAGEPWVPVAAQVPEPGVDVIVVGHPYGVRAPSGFLEGTLRWSTAQGVVSAVGPRTLQFDAPVNPGNSGGAVLGPDGELVAVVSRKSAGGEGLGFGARAERVTSLLAEPRRGLGPIGGTVALGVAASMYGGDGGTWSAGPQVEVALRDRLVLTGAWNLGIGARWDALDFGDVSWLGPEARVGLRQRLFRGPSTARLDVFVGVAGEQRIRAGVVDTELELERDLRALAILGGGIRIANGGFELSWTETGAVRAAVVLRWPGVISVF